MSEVVTISCHGKGSSFSGGGGCSLIVVVVRIISRASISSRGSGCSSRKSSCL